MAYNYYEGDKAWWKNPPYGPPVEGTIKKVLGGEKYIISGPGFESQVKGTDLSIFKPTKKERWYKNTSSFLNGCTRAEKEIQNKLQNAGMKTKEWIEGARAFDTGKTDDQNPYPKGSKQNFDWGEGFLAYWNNERRGNEASRGK